MTNLHSFGTVLLKFGT